MSAISSADFFTYGDGTSKFLSDYMPGNIQYWCEIFWGTHLIAICYETKLFRIDIHRVVASLYVYIDK